MIFIFNTHDKYIDLSECSIVSKKPNKLILETNTLIHPIKDNKMLHDSFQNYSFNLFLYMDGSIYRINTNHLGERNNNGEKIYQSANIIDVIDRYCFDTKLELHLLLEDQDTEGILLKIAEVENTIVDNNLNEQYEKNIFLSTYYDKLGMDLNLLKHFWKQTSKMDLQKENCYSF